MNPPNSSTPPESGAPSPAEASTTPPRRVNEASGWRSVVLLPLYFVVRLWCASLRFSMPAPERAWISDPDRQVIIVIWHNRLFLTGEMRRRYRSGRRIVSLVSASRDGAWLTAFFTLMGMHTARGSSSWRGMQAARELLAETRTGTDIALTPDGPRGPCYEIKPGALMAARLTKLPLLLISARFLSTWRLRSWDGFFLPKPFSKVEIRTRLLPGYACLDAGDNDEAAARELRRQLMEITVDE